MLLLFSLPLWACQEPLQLRTVTPDEGSVDIPLDARILISFLGWGELKEYDVSLTLYSKEVPVTREEWCYEHEGPDEVHCWIRLRPDEPLEPQSN